MLFRSPLRKFRQRVLFSDIFRGSNNKEKTCSHWDGDGIPRFYIAWDDGHVGHYVDGALTVYPHIESWPGTGGHTQVFRVFDAKGK